MRPMQILPLAASEGGDGRLALQDPEGLLDGVVALPGPVVALLYGLLDGTRDRAALEADWEKATGRALPSGELEGLLERLDDALLLEGSRLEEARRTALEAYRSRPSRRATHAGAAYPEDGAAFARHVRDAREASGVGVVQGPVHAVLAPHIDPRGGSPCHGAAMAAIAASPAEVFVVLGTAHASLRRPFALTTKDFETPLGTLATDRALVERLAARGGGDLLEDERAHAPEHSVEFQAAWIQAVHRGRPRLRIVPVLVGSLRDRIQDGRSPLRDEPMRDFVEALRELRAEHGDRMALVASVDLAHVGPRYGWSRAPDRKVLDVVLEADRRLLGRALELDGEGWIRFLQGEKDVRNVCGAAPVYVFLHALRDAGLEGRLLRHDAWEIDPETGSHVSFAAVAYGPPAA
jgi:AmmeMemoRadiSam system protein B